MSYQDILTDYRHYKSTKIRLDEEQRSHLTRTPPPFNHGAHVRQRSYGGSDRQSEIAANIIGMMMSNKISVDEQAPQSRSASPAASVRSPCTPRGRPIGSTKPPVLRGTTPVEQHDTRQSQQQPEEHQSDGKETHSPVEKKVTLERSRRRRSREPRDDFASLREENTKLRKVEEQFWILLSEREDLQQQNKELMMAAGIKCPRRKNEKETKKIEEKIPFSRAIVGKTNNGRGDEQPSYTAADIKSMEAALGQCMDIILRQETGQDGGHDQQSLVRDFVDFCRQRSEQSNVASPSLSSLSEVSPLISTDVNMNHEALIDAKQKGEVEVQRLKELLKKTDQSRLHSLEDAERYRGQVSTLSGAVGELRLSLQDERDEVVRLRQQLVTEVNFYQTEIRQREAETERTRHAMELLASKYEAVLRQASEGEQSRAQQRLLDDAARIRHEISARVADLDMSDDAVPKSSNKIVVPSSDSVSKLKAEVTRTTSLSSTLGRDGGRHETIIIDDADTEV